MRILLVQAPVSSVTPINATPIAGNIYTASAIPGTIYYYRVKARNSTTQSDFSYMVVGYTSGTMTLYKENFDDSVFNVPWDVHPAMGGTTYSFDTFDFINGTASLLVQNSACTGGCGYSYYWGLTKTFGTAVSYFDVRVSFTKQYTGTGRVGVFVNNPYPTDDTNLVPFIITMFPSGNWVQRFTMHQDPGNIFSITILVYDVTDLNPINVDDITIHTMP